MSGGRLFKTERWWAEGNIIHQAVEQAQYTTIATLSHQNSLTDFGIVWTIVTSDLPHQGSLRSVQTKLWEFGEFGDRIRIAKGDYVSCRRIGCGEACDT